MIDFKGVVRDIKETLEEGREVTIYNDTIYRHFYVEKEKIISCNDLGEKEKEYNTLEDLFEEINFTEESISNYTIEMY